MSRGEIPGRLLGGGGNDDGTRDTTVAEPVIPFGHSKSLGCLCIPSARHPLPFPGHLAAQNGQHNQGGEAFQVGVLDLQLGGLRGPRAVSPPTPTILLRSSAVALLIEGLSSFS